jgi:tetratricopeptide (TPR) repeat protein
VIRTPRSHHVDASKHYKKAVRDFSKAVTVDPTAATAKVRYTLGKVYLLTGDYDRAIDSLTQAINKKPDYGLAYANRGVGYRSLGDYPNAAQDFRKALTLLKKESRVTKVRELLADTETRIKQYQPQEKTPVTIPGRQEELTWPVVSRYW